MRTTIITAAIVLSTMAFNTANAGIFDMDAGLTPSPSMPTTGVLRKKTEVYNQYGQKVARADAPSTVDASKVPLPPSPSQAAAADPMTVFKKKMADYNKEHEAEFARKKAEQDRLKAEAERRRIAQAAPPPPAPEPTVEEPKTESKPVVEAPKVRKVVRVVRPRRMTRVVRRTPAPEMPGPRTSVPAPVISPSKGTKGLLRPNGTAVFGGYDGGTCVKPTYKDVGRVTPLGAGPSMPCHGAQYPTQVERAVLPVRGLTVRQVTVSAQNKATGRFDRSVISRAVESND